MEEVKTKVCSKCKIEKPFNCFYKDNKAPTSFSYVCKLCTNTRQKEIVKQNPEKQKESIRLSKIKHKEGVLFAGARWRAKTYGMEFNITLEDIGNIPDICPILEIPIFRDLKEISDNSPTLDRIDNSKGYIKGNVEIISRRANTLKSMGTAEEHLKIYEHMVKHIRKNSL